MGNIRQTIIFRKDLNVRKGKLGAQVAHASMLSLISSMTRKEIKDTDSDESIIVLEAKYCKNSWLDEWLEGSFTKICLGCDSEEELLGLYQKAKDCNLPVVLVTDNGLTEFNGVKTNTCIAIGPAPKELIDNVTSELKPL